MFGLDSRGSNITSPFEAAPNILFGPECPSTQLPGQCRAEEASNVHLQLTDQVFKYQPLVFENDRDRTAPIGTHSIPYERTVPCEHKPPNRTYVSITADCRYSEKSFEELRLEDITLKSSTEQTVWPHKEFTDDSFESSISSLSTNKDLSDIRLFVPYTTGRHCEPAWLERAFSNERGSYFYAHRCILEARCPALVEAFSEMKNDHDDYSEGDCNNVPCVKIPSDLSPSAVRDFGVRVHSVHSRKSGVFQRERSFGDDFVGPKIRNRWIGRGAC
eukprot:369734_1